MNIKDKITKQLEDYKKIQEYLKDNFESFLSAVCEEFINYYGEEYRDIITYRLYNTNYVFYINELEPLMGTFGELSDKENLTENYKEIKSQYKSAAKLIKKVQGYCNRYNEKHKNSKIFVSADRKVYDTTKNTYDLIDKSIRENTLEYLIKGKDICFVPIYLENSNIVEHDVVVPLFKINDEDLIHEMIHAAMFQDLYIKNNKLGYKSGLSIAKDSEELLEECITEIEANNISKRLKEKGISFIDKFFPKYTNSCFYDNFIPFVEDFYYSFKDALTYSRISLNKSYLLEQINRDNYYNFMVAFAECYREYFSKDDFYYYKNKIGEETKKMKDSYKVLKLK